MLIYYAPFNIDQNWSLQLVQNHAKGKWTVIAKNSNGDHFKLKSDQIINNSKIISEKKFFAWVAGTPSKKGLGKLFEISKIGNETITLKIFPPRQGLLGGNPEDEEMLDEGTNDGIEYIVAEKKNRDLPLEKRKEKVCAALEKRTLGFSRLPASIKESKIKSLHLIPNPDNKPIRSENLELQKKFLKFAWTFQMYMESHLFNPNYGYYSAGKVEFNKDFATASSKSPILAEQMANQCFITWKTMIESGDLQKGDNFDVVELGAGDGKNVKDLFAYLKRVIDAYQDPELKEFYSVLNYHIGEFSPALRERQAKLNEEYLESGKLKIYAADARDLMSAFDRHQFKGLVFSNELVDAFPLHQIRLNTKNEIEVLTVIPSIDENAFSFLSEKQKEKWLERSENIKNSFKDLLPQTDLQKKVFFSAKDVEKIPVELLPSIKWWHVYLSPELFPDVLTFLKDIDGSGYLSTLKPDDKTYINTGIPKFMEGVDHILEKGFVITIDYGSNNKGKLHTDKNLALRTYGKKNRKYNPQLRTKFHKGLGECDLTADLNFSNLAEAGQMHHLMPVKFLYQNDIGKIMKIDNIKPLPYKDFRSYEFMKFGVLLQRKDSTNSLFNIPGKRRNATQWQILQKEMKLN